MLGDDDATLRSRENCHVNAAHPSRKSRNREINGAQCPIHTAQWTVHVFEQTKRS